MLKIELIAGECTPEQLAATAAYLLALSGAAGAPGRFTATRPTPVTISTPDDLRIKLNAVPGETPASMKPTTAADVTMKLHLDTDEAKEKLQSLTALAENYVRIAPADVPDVGAHVLSVPPRPVFIAPPPSALPAENPFAVFQAQAAAAVSASPNVAPSTAVAGPSSTAPAVTPVSSIAPPSVSTPSAQLAPTVVAPPAAPTNAVAVDSSGQPWDARIHSATRTKVTDGTWRIARGTDKELIEQVRAERRALMGVQAAPTAPAEGNWPFAVPVQKPATAVDSYVDGEAEPVPNVPAATVAPPPAAVTPTAPVAGPISGDPDIAALTSPTVDFFAIMEACANLVQRQKLTMDIVNATCKQVGLPQGMSDLCIRPDLAGMVGAAIARSVQ